MNVPLVSVIIPAYNAEPWLAEAIGSVIGQTLSDWQLIIVNDGSTDRTSEVARSFNDLRIQVIDKANGGVSTARNTGIDTAIGTCIAFLDADDAMASNDLETKMAALQDHGVDWVFSDMWRCDEHLRPSDAPDQGTDGDVISTILTGRGIAVPAAPSNLLVRRKCFDTGIRFDPDLSNSADQDMVIRLALAFPYAHVPEPLFFYRVWPGSMSRNVVLYQHDHLKLFEKIRASGLLDKPAYRRRCMANAYWAIGGSWWVDADNKCKALPFLLRAIAMRPVLLLKPIRRRSRSA